ncbi:hypothetical protein HPB48_020859 [Haemaphysalis longicornis]|uniref:NADP-dependent oxidoreductase domain-containing protein n=1 Tax=Haemaphysalis longicornis TaxID=44386 RepID=A0A9J6GK26_HAELO|nr:hypothetical protein HPB48_020859 [Haemaphysalis longicornis]
MQGMEEAANLGMTRSIGLCNFNKTQISRILEVAMIKPANLQVLIRWLLQRGIVPLPRSTSPAHIQENIQVSMQSGKLVFCHRKHIFPGE